MATRYIPTEAFSTTVKGNTYSTVFSPDRQNPAGLIGYSDDEIKGLPAALVKKLFKTVTVEEPVERATAAPGEKRAVSKPKTKTKS